jgi:hypothetical protein
LERKGYRDLARETKIDKNTICSLTNTATNKLIDSNELTKLLNPQNYSGIILIDGKYTSVKNLNNDVGCYFKKRRGNIKRCLVVIPFMDYLTHDIPIYQIAKSENMFDIEQGFLKLKEIGYPLKVVICDESMGEIAQIAKKIFPDVIIQICLTHYSRNISKTFKIDSVKRTIKKLNKKLEQIGDSILIPTHHYNIEQARQIVNEIADLEFRYKYLIDIDNIFKEIFWGTNTIKKLNRLEDELNEYISKINLKTYEFSKEIKARYNDYYLKRNYLISFINHKYINIPNTTNLIEGLNSTTFEIRFSSIRGFQKEETARNYINAMILHRRFKKFTDCRSKFKKLNGKCSLEIANPKNILNFNFDSDNWISFCQKLKEKI